MAALLIAFVFGPGVIRFGYSLSTDSSDIAALKERYWTLESSGHLLAAAQQQAADQRRLEIAAWLGMRGIKIDPGLRDESVEHAAYPIYLYGITRWAWLDIFRYWSAPSDQLTLEHLLSDFS